MASCVHARAHSFARVSSPPHPPAFFHLLLLLLLLRRRRLLALSNSVFLTYCCRLANRNWRFDHPFWVFQRVRAAIFSLQSFSKCFFCRSRRFCSACLLFSPCCCYFRLLLQRCAGANNRSKGDRRRINAPTIDQYASGTN